VVSLVENKLDIVTLVTILNVMIIGNESCEKYFGTCYSMVDDKFPEGFLYRNSDYTCDGYLVFPKQYEEYLSEIKRYRITDLYSFLTDTLS
jgi:hypothetical protein